MTELKFEIPVRTISEANGRECWQAKSSRAKKQRELAKRITSQMLCGVGQTKALIVGAILGGKVCWSYKKIIVTLTRKGTRPLDSDNLAGSQKAVRDGIAEAFGIDDGKPIWEWRYEQAKVKRENYVTPYGTSVHIRLVEE